MPLLVLVLTLAVFLPALDHGFVNWDDDKNLLENPHYRGLGWSELRWMWTNHLTGHYIPITWMSLGLDYALWGMDPAGYHLTNLTLHAVNAVLFYFLMLLLLRMGKPGSDGEENGGLFLGAMFAALFFALHPLRVESVGWVTERRDVLSGFFSLLATFAYLLAAQSGRRRKYYLASLILFVLALLSKEITVTLPALFVVLDIFPLRRLGQPGRWFGPSVRSVWLEKIPFFVISLASCTATWLIGLREGTVTSLTELGWLTRIEISIYGLGFYIRKTLAPFHLSPMYPLTKEKIDPVSWQFILSAAAVLAITVIAILYRRRYPALLAAWLVYGIILLPVLGVVQNGRQIAADRYSYLACLGWALLGGVLVETCWRRWGGRLMGRTLILGAGALTIAGLGVLTSNQLAIWQNSETLWTYALSNEPSLVAYENLGMAVAERGDLQGALENFQQALQIDPNDAEVHNDMGATLIALGKTDTAIPHFREAVRNKPNLANAHYGLGYALSLQGEMGAAIQEYQTALKLNPGYEAARRDLAKARALIYPRGQPPRSEWFEQ